MPGLFFIILLIVALVVWSLIPAFVSKLLMNAVFKRRVFFGMTLLAMVLGSVFTMVAYFGLVWYTQGTLDPEIIQNVEASMTPAGGALLTLFGFMLQVLFLTFIVPDENMELIASWKWAVIFALQYVVIILIVFAIVFLLSSLGGISSFDSAHVGSPTSQILTRVV